MQTPSLQARRLRELVALQRKATELRDAAERLQDALERGLESYAASYLRSDDTAGISRPHHYLLDNQLVTVDVRDVFGDPEIYEDDQVLRLGPCTVEIRLKVAPIENPDSRPVGLLPHTRG